MNPTDSINEIKEKIAHILDELIPKKDLTLREKLSVVGSDSLRAIVFLSALEDEFDMELDDEFITPEFFIDIDFMADCVDTAIKTTTFR